MTIPSAATGVVAATPGSQASIAHHHPWTLAGTSPWSYKLKPVALIIPTLNGLGGNTLLHPRGGLLGRRGMERGHVPSPAGRHQYHSKRNTYLPCVSVIPSG